MQLAQLVGGGVEEVLDSVQYQSHPSNVLGKFRLIAELGRGGMSEVYLAVVAGPAGFNKLMVLKLIKNELAEDPEFIAMFLEEARLSARLNHPNIVQTNEVGEHNGRYFIAMEYLEGQPFSRIINRLGRDRGLPLGMGLRILSDVLSGLHHAHELRDFDGSALEVVHRDVTPHNVFITYDGQVKVVDFGIAKAMNSSNETRAGMLKGKVGYMAPEQARGERVDRRADVFSVGVMLWEVAVGRRMWKGHSEIQVLHQLMQGEIPRPRSMRPDISDRLEEIIMKSLSIDRQHRHASCLELQADLDELMDGGNERTTLREVGRRVQAAFDEERVKLAQIIETQLARTNLPTGMYQQVQLPNLEQHPMTGEHQAMRPSFNPTMSGAQSQGHLPRLGGSGSHPSHSGANASWQQSQPSYQGTPPSHPGQYGNAGPLSGQQNGQQNGQQSSQQNSQRGAPQSHHGQQSHGQQSNHGQQSPYAPNVPSVGAGPQPSSYSHPFTPHSHSGNTGSIARANLSAGMRQSGSVPVAQSNRMTFVALAVAIAAAGLVGLLYFNVGRPSSDPSKTVGQSTEGGPGTASAATTSASTTVATAATPTSAPTGAATSQATAAVDEGSVTLKIVVKPKDAKVFLDDRKLADNPFVLPKDGQSHKLRIEAPGYVARTRDFKATDDLTWDLELAPDARPGKPVVKKDPPPKEDDGKMTSGHTVRPVDTSYTP